MQPIPFELTQTQALFVKRHLPLFDTVSYTVTVAGKAGSARIFVRIKHNDIPHASFVLVVWDGRDPDWDRYVAIPRELSSYTNLLPKIVIEDKSLGLLLVEDLGSEILLTTSEKSTSVMQRAYEAVMLSLVTWQSIPPHSAPSIAARTMDYDVFKWESDYFTLHCVEEYFHLKHSLTSQYYDECTALARRTASFPVVPMHRDFQSENILLYNGEVRFVDYQGARLGPALYDVASLVFDPYNEHLDDTMVNHLLQFYYKAQGVSKSPSAEFTYCSIQRLLQALGAYCNLSINKKKPHYEQFIPRALQRLKNQLDSTPDFKAISKVVGNCLARM